jgi:hypothetical protein
MRRNELSAVLGLAAGIATVGVLTGCPNREISRVDPVQDKVEIKDIPVQLNRDVDLLFVIDNSGSMEEEQTSLATNFPQFINVLQTIEGGLPNVHIGVVSSDMGAGAFNISNCSGNGDNGELQAAARVSGCAAPTGNFIRDVADGAGGRDTNYTGDLASAFSCIAQLGTTGCGFEQHLESMRRALEPSNSVNNGFIRDNAYLAVIFIADEDDCSTRDNNMFDTTQNDPAAPLGALSSFRCYEFGVDCETGNGNPRAPGPRENCFPREDSPYMYGVQEYVDFLINDVKNGEESLVIAAGIIGNAEPVAVGSDPERSIPALVPSCQSGSGKADPAVRLKFFIDQFGAQSAFSTICNENLSDALLVIADLLKEVIGNPCIESTLRDANLNEDGIQYDCVVADVVNPDEPDEQETILPACNAAEDNNPSNAPNSTNTPCWHLATDTDRCGDTPMQLALVIERAGQSVPPGTHVQASCVTCVDEDANGVCD